MFNGFNLTQRHYFHRHLQRQLQELYVTVAIMDFALAAVIVFEPIYLWQRGYGVTDIMLYYVIVYSLYFFLAPLGGKIVARFGPARSISASTIFLASYYGALLLIALNPAWFWVSPVLFAVQKMLYWPAYHVDFLEHSDPAEQAKEYSALWSLSTAVAVLGPAIGGVVAAVFGFPVLFIGAMTLILLSSIPLFIATTPHIPTHFSYRSNLFHFFQHEHWKQLFGFLGLGEELILLTIWPLFLALRFENYQTFGGAIAAATLITALCTLALGEYLDHHQPKIPLRFATIGTVMIWLTRPFVHAVQLVFLSDTLGRFVKNGSFVSLSSIVYRRARDDGRYIRHAVLFEQGFSIAKTLTALLVIIVAQWWSPFTVSFIVAGLISLLYLVV
jgi:MFS family permease